MNIDRSEYTGHLELTQLTSPTPPSHDDHDPPVTPFSGPKLLAHSALRRRQTLVIITIAVSTALTFSGWRLHSCPLADWLPTPPKVRKLAKLSRKIS